MLCRVKKRYLTFFLTTLYALLLSKWLINSMCWRRRLLKNIKCKCLLRSEHFFKPFYGKKGRSKLQWNSQVSLLLVKLAWNNQLKSICGKKRYYNRTRFLMRLSRHRDVSKRGLRARVGWKSKATAHTHIYMIFQNFYFSSALFYLQRNIFKLP